MNPSDSIFQGASETYPPASQQPAATGVPVSTTRQDHHGQRGPRQDHHGQRGAWSSDLCDCFSDVPSCMSSFHVILSYQINIFLVLYTFSPSFSVGCKICC
uniref:Protein PLANT CADMIUM RESISTANCE 2 isoform X1 n=1 Tax=Rhizophora mucronata TaxID=61149 RepID=A0A2P2MA48_RHIMU